MSKFFAGGADDSDFSSSEEEDLYGSDLSESGDEAPATGARAGAAGGASESDDSEDMSDGSGQSDDDDEEDDGEGEGEDGANAPARGQYMRNQFLKGQGGSSSDDDSSDDDKKVVKSAKTKLLDEIETAIKGVESASSSSDWISAASAFDRVLKSTERAQRQYNVVPASVARTLTQLEDSVPEAVKAGRKGLSPSQSKALNTLNQRLKKALKEYASRVASYRESPSDYQPDANAAAAAAAAADSVADSSAAASARGSPAPGGPVDIEYGPETTFKTLQTVIEMRGKKSTDRTEQVAVLEKQLAATATAYQKISVLLMLIPVRFDTTSSGSIMPLATWKAIEADIRTLFDVLEKNADSYMVIESAKEPEDLEQGPAPGPGGIRQIPGSLSVFVERLDDEYTRALQNIDPHTTEYIDRLRDETKLYDLFLRTQVYIERNLAVINQDIHDSESLCRLFVRRIDHIYYRPSNAITAVELEAWAQVPEPLNSKITPRLTALPTDPQAYTVDLINSLSKVLYRQPNTVFRARAMLGLVYHYALNDYYNKARDLMLMSHLQSTIHTAEPVVQVLFNRALVQVGLCAFRVGLVPEAMQSLQEICSSSRLKELLGQGVTKFSSTPSTDRSQLLPFHMHINLELIECVYLTSALLIEIPYVASLRNSADSKKKAISKSFRRMLDYNERQVFNGPSENTRDHIIQAARSLQQGDWRTSSELLKSIRVWSLLANSEGILKMLDEKLKIEGLRTYLFTYGYCYESLSLEYLSELSDLPATQVQAIVTKMIATDEIAATFDESSAYVYFQAEADLSKTQILSLALSDKLLTLMERNERLAGDGHGPEQNQNKPLNKKPMGRTPTPQATRAR